ncbi:DUF3786 domain-containing protein [Desulfosarcina ovata]|uniref:DUF3786 domain-containing protein n=1 Tax=Desulfosarcina ovata subsp. ovata TaxID=2752305 RepID=A0A5K8AC20_9BACT|nr:DUF3786 domain-containing protein [Desulfosarcina ovata]BBO89500.1 hypothetical protein DSCOOX_26800 [Desulfosarcina ovata subsp. ovata]
MAMTSDVFKKNYQTYLAQIANLDLTSAAPILGLESRGDQFSVTFFGQPYLISKEGFVDESGTAPSYGVCVILAKYLLRCPAQIHRDEDWCAFRDFKKESHFTNVNYFASDTEKAIVGAFTGRIDALFEAGEKLGGVREEGLFNYDLVLRFTALPRIDLLLLFADGDEDFPAYGTTLFQKQAEYYLDPESLAMTGAALTRRLKDAAVSPI